jgi:hypothetical protein
MFVLFAEFNRIPFALVQQAYSLLLLLVPTSVYWGRLDSLGHDQDR